MGGHIFFNVVVIFAVLNVKHFKRDDVYIKMKEKMISSPLK